MAPKTLAPTFTVDSNTGCHSTKSTRNVGRTDHTHTPMNSPELATAEGTGSSADARPKRSRTGCMTCRNRRRKCDEGKPVCQNCISKGIECRYAATFQILGKHNFTPEIKTDVKYANVRFVNDEGDGPVNECEAQSILAAKSQHDRVPVQIQPTTPFDKQAGIELFETGDRSFPSHTESLNSYQFALHGLIALGSTANAIGGANFAPAAAIDEELAISTYSFASGDDMDPALDDSDAQRRLDSHKMETEQQPMLSRDTVNSSMPGSTPRLVACEGRGSTQALQVSVANASNRTGHPHTHEVLGGQSLELLKVYRYHIAPWLDICDADQHFGVMLLTKSTQSARLRASIIALAEAASSMTWASQCENFASDTSNRNTFNSNEPDTAMEMVVDVLDVLGGAIPNLAAFWMGGDREQNRLHLMKRLIHELGSSRISACTYWLLVRLELSCALMTGINRIPLPFLPDQLVRFENDDWTARCAYDVIALCADSAMFAQGDDDRWLQRRHGRNRVETWKTIVQAFAHWYMHRSQAFQPIIELYPRDGVLADDDFPTIVFTSGAALLANQLYHTGMLLLLQNKPRFADKPISNSPSMSILWHAHRVCGIAIQNDRPGWWDPCLVASLIVAGRTATHRSQHSIIISTLESVQRLTGWVIDTYVDQLRNEWQLADG